MRPCAPQPAREVTVADIHEAMAEPGRVALMSARMRPLQHGQKITGPAVTAFCWPGDNLMMHRALYLAQPGDVLVVVCQAELSGAQRGGLTTQYAMKKGLAGVVVQGCVRDTDIVRKLSRAASAFNGRFVCAVQGVFMKFAHIALSALLGSASAAHPQDSWVIGHSAPLSGGNAKFGTDIRDGTKVAALTAKGGVQGRPIELVTLDDKNDRKTAAANAGKLLEDKDLLALFGFASATLSLDALPQAEKKGVAFFAPFSGANPVRTDSPVLFTVHASYGEEMEKMQNFWTSLGFKRVTVIHYDDEVGRQNLDVVSRHLKKINLVSQALPLKRNTPIGKPEIEKLLAQTSDFLLNTALSGAAAQIQKELVAQGRMIPTSSLSFVGADQYITAAGPSSAGARLRHVI